MVSVQLLPLPRSPLRRWRPAPLLVLAAGVLAPLLAPAPGRAAEELRLQLDGLELPIDLVELEAWARQSDQNGLNRAGPQDLAVWLNLLEPGSRASSNSMTTSISGRRLTSAFWVVCM